MCLAIFLTERYEISGDGGIRKSTLRNEKKDLVKFSHYQWFISMMTSMLEHIFEFLAWSLEFMSVLSRSR